MPVPDASHVVSAELPATRVESALHCACASRAACSARVKVWRFESPTWALVAAIVKLALALAPARLVRAAPKIADTACCRPASMLASDESCLAWAPRLPTSRDALALVISAL